MARVVMDAMAVGHIEFAVSEFLDTKLGPLIAADAQRYAPKRSGRLAESIGWDVHGLTLYVFATAYYAGWVEMGHRKFHPSTGEVGPEWVPEQPYLRPALYKFRTPAMPDPTATFPVAVPHPGHEYRSLFAYERARERTGPRIPREAVRENNRYWQQRGK